MAFDTVSHKILINKLLMYELDGETMKWIENWLHGLAQRVMIIYEKSTKGDFSQMENLVGGQKLAGQ